MHNSIQNFRNLLPFLSQLTFLDHAATSSVLSSSINVMNSTVNQMQEPLRFHADQWRALIEETRERLAVLLNVSSKSLAFTQNTSTSLSIIAHSISLKPGDKVLIPIDEFPSNRYIWQNLKNKAIDYDWIPVKKDESIIETLSQMNLKNVKLISISAVSYLTGRQYDLKAFATFCRERNILSCLDAIQAIGTIPFDISDIGVDFVASDSRKWLLSPMGCGFLYINPAILDKLYVPIVGWNSAKDQTKRLEKTFEFAENASRFEPAFPNVVSLSGLNHSLKELAAIGWQTIYDHISENVNYLKEKLNQLGFELMISQTNRSALVSFFMPNDFNEAAFDRQLKEKKVLVTKRDGYIRVSPHFYSTKEEMNAFLGVIDSVL